MPQTPYCWHVCARAFYSMRVHISTSLHMNSDDKSGCTPFKNLDPPPAYVAKKLAI